MGIFGFDLGLNKKFASVSHNSDGNLVVGVPTRRFDEKGNYTTTEIVTRPVNGHEELIAVAKHLQARGHTQG